MIITTNFDIGQTVFLIEICGEEDKICPLCNGDRKVRLSKKYGSKMMECGRCYGRGEVVEWGEGRFKVVPVKVLELRVDAWGALDGIGETYKIAGDREIGQGRWIPIRNNLYASEEEAALEVARRVAEKAAYLATRFEE